MAGLDPDFQRRGDAVGRATPSATCRRSRTLDPSKTVLGNVEEGVAPIRALLTRFDEINAKFGEELSPEEMDKVLEEQAQGAGRDRGRRRLGSRLEARARDGRAAPAAGRRGRHEALGRRAAPRGALPAAAAVARPAAPRRADQPPRRRVGGVARALPARVQGHGRRDHARPLLPRQRRRLDSRARSHARRFPWEGNYSSWLDQKQQRLAVEEKQEIEAAADAAARARVDPHVAARAAGQGQGAPQRVRAAARRGHGRQDRSRRDLHSARPAARRRRRRSARSAQGLRRSAAHRRPRLHAAARRHRRRDRPERRRQDDAVPDAGRAGDSRTAAR